MAVTDGGRIVYSPGYDQLRNNRWRLRDGHVESRYFMSNNGAGTGSSYQLSMIKAGTVVGELDDGRVRPCVNTTCKLELVAGTDVVLPDADTESIHYLLVGDKVLIDGDLRTISAIDTASNSFTITAAQTCDAGSTVVLDDGSDGTALSPIGISDERVVLKEPVVNEDVETVSADRFGKVMRSGDVDPTYIILGSTANKTALTNFNFID